MIKKYALLYCVVISRVVPSAVHPIHKAQQPSHVVIDQDLLLCPYIQPQTSVDNNLRKSEYVTIVVCVIVVCVSGL